ncbi:hypothetical protein QJU89_00450 [Pasteurella skyensis]|uniref:Uncharacterized protein n=1 Tax=Phocoenobacter skyensis TaxID=97481 RepID=A0AAJ6NZW8_9PAST|nr:hypothetical protein [Pasteurella skyensis]MDP8161804.1 hypothetical protein [Pasteurella skyensis]MDP8171960.1 hypothetical protein [Pasteurella skyensis]MDP8176195.1 hypothetical protein [Pasteurella skyensis]MDP8178215.1 hypothetical protein [Pasteurella skyensis]MDP8182177.1 hypothetical protein [Pasteurella skyensis]
MTAMQKIHPTQSPKISATRQEKMRKSAHIFAIITAVIFTPHVLADEPIKNEVVTNKCDLNGDGQVRGIKERICEEKREIAQFDKNIAQSKREIVQFDKNIAQSKREIVQLDKEIQQLIEDIRENVKKLIHLKNSLLREVTIALSTI